MVHKFQELENYDDYDPVPYKGGYDINEAYGGVKAADDECGYPRAGFGEDEEEQHVEYGNESNPYEHGPPGPSIFGGRPRPGAVYGGGRDRTQPSHDEAQPDEGVETGYGRQRPAYGGDEQSGNDRPSYDQEGQESGYSKPRPSYGYGGEEESEYRKPAYEEEESGYQRPSYEGQESRYRRPAYGEESGYTTYGKPRPTYGEGEVRYQRPSYGEEGSEYQRPDHGEEEYGYQQPYNYGGEETGGAYGYGRTRYSRDDESSEVRSGSVEMIHRDEEGDYGGYGGRRNENLAARFGGGSAYTEEPAPDESAPRRTWW